MRHEEVILSGVRVTAAFPPEPSFALSVPDSFPTPFYHPGKRRRRRS
jgi:hypothetical protein